MSIRPVLDFDDLPAGEKALICAVLNALNRADSQGTLDDLALIHPRDDARSKPKKRPPPLPSVIALKRAFPEEWADAVEDAKVGARQLSELWRKEFDAFRDRLALIAREGRLSEADARLLKTLFLSGVAIEPQVQLHNGRAAITTPFKFRSGIAAVAYAVLRLSELSAHGPALLRCAECGTFAVITATGGRRAQRFCSLEHQNRFNQRQWHRKKAEADRQSTEALRS